MSVCVARVGVAPKSKKTYKEAISRRKQYIKKKCYIYAKMNITKESSINET